MSDALRNPTRRSARVPHTSPKSSYLRYIQLTVEPLYHLLITGEEYMTLLKLFLLILELTSQDLSLFFAGIRVFR